MNILSGYIILLSVVLTHGFDTRFSVHVGKCPEEKGVQDFDYKKYEGYWYYLELLNEPLGATQDCLSIHYQGLKSDNTFKANCAFKSFGGDDAISLGNGTLISRNDNRTVLLVDSQLPLMQNSTVASGIQFIDKNRSFVLATDYDSYTIEWTCDAMGKLPGTYKETLSIASRRREYLPGTKDKVYYILSDYGFNVRKLIAINHKNCSDNLNY